MAMKEKTKRIDLITDDLGDINFGDITISIENFKEKIKNKEETEQGKELEKKEGEEN